MRAFLFEANLQERLFIALEFPTHIINELITIQQKIHALQLFEGSYIKPEQLHLTLLFFGKVDIKCKQLIQEVLRKIHYPSFEGFLGKLGIFPNQKNIRIIWIDFNAPELAALVSLIENSLKPIVKLEEREFVSHITLARVKRVYDTRTFIQHLSTIQFANISCKITEFILKKSELMSKGSIYNDVEHYSLTL